MAEMADMYWEYESTVNDCHGGRSLPRLELLYPRTTSCAEACALPSCTLAAIVGSERSSSASRLCTWTSTRSEMPKRYTCPSPESTSVHREVPKMRRSCLVAPLSVVIGNPR